MGRVWHFSCLFLALGARFLPLIQDTILPTDTNDKAPILPLTPTLGRNTCHGHHQWDIIPPPTPTMGQYSPSYRPQVHWISIFSHWPLSLMHCLLPLILGHFLLPPASAPLKSKGHWTAPLFTKFGDPCSIPKEMVWPYSIDKIAKSTKKQNTEYL